MPGLQSSPGEYGSLAFLDVDFNLNYRAVTHVRVGIDIAKVLGPKILKLVIPAGLAVLAYTYIQTQRSVR